MHEVIRTAVSPATALAVGLEVDASALPPAVKTGIVNRTIDLNSPATTVALLKLGAVVGVVGDVDESNTLTRVGITCALCHSTGSTTRSPLASASDSMGGRTGRSTSAQSSRCRRR